MNHLLLNYTPRKVKNLTKEQLLAEDVWNFLGKPKKGYGSFPSLMSIIKKYGTQWVYECFNETRQADCDDRGKLFMWKIGQAKIQFPPAKH